MLRLKKQAAADRSAKGESHCLQTLKLRQQMFSARAGKSALDGGIRLVGQKTFLQKVDAFPQQRGRRRVQFLKGKVQAGVAWLLWLVLAARWFFTPFAATRRP